MASDQLETSAAAPFKRDCVLLTGATGFIGSLVLEKLLRSSDCPRKVFVTVRAKRNQDPQQRLQALLQDHALFALARQQVGLSRLLAGVQAIAADLAAPDCGIAPADWEVLTRDVSVIIHAAATLQLDLHIHDALQQNYFPAAGLLRLARSCKGFRAFCYVSTAYVNANLSVAQPRKTLVMEQIYPLVDQGLEVDHAALVAKLMALTRQQAELETRRLMRQWGYLNTYLVSKTLTERLVMEQDLTSATADDASRDAACCGAGGDMCAPIPVCIVRPALCGAVAKTPLPGYIGNASGATSAMLACATGVATCTGFRPDSIMPVVPSDVVAEVILAATATRATAARRTADSAADGHHQHIYHVCSSATHPITNSEFTDYVVGYLADDPLLHQNKLLVPSKPQPPSWVSERAFHRRAAARGCYYWLISLLLQAGGQAQMANKVMLGWKMWANLAPAAMDHDLRYSCDGAQRMLAALPAAQQGESMLVWSADQGHDWTRYMRTYVAGVKHRYLREPPQTKKNHNYVALL